jgi:hypothetical protein
MLLLLCFCAASALLPRRDMNGNATTKWRARDGIIFGKTARPPEQGGAIYNSAGSVVIDGSTTFSGNTCGGDAPCGPDVSNGVTGDVTFAGSRSVSFGG